MTVVREFHEATGAPFADAPTGQPAEVVRLRMRLINEEVKEVNAELAALLRCPDVDSYIETLGRLLKELCDLRYVTEGCAVTFGLPIDAAYVEVHRSNMSKLGGGIREDGKVLKGPNYSPADMTAFVPPITDVTFEEDPQ